MSHDRPAFVANPADLVRHLDKLVDSLATDAERHLNELLDKAADVDRQLARLLAAIEDETR